MHRDVHRQPYLSMDRLAGRRRRVGDHQGVVDPVEIGPRVPIRGNSATDAVRARNERKPETELNDERRAGDTRWQGDPLFERVRPDQLCTVAVPESEADDAARHVGQILDVDAQHHLVIELDGGRRTTAGIDQLDAPDLGCAGAMAEHTDTRVETGVGLKAHRLRLGCHRRYGPLWRFRFRNLGPVSYTHLRAHET